MNKIFLLLAFTLSTTSLFAQGIPKVTVAKFKNSSGYVMQTTDSVTDTFISLLIETKRFEIIERERLKELNEESLFSGKLKIDGCEYIFLNNIATLDIQTSKNNIKFLKISSLTAEVSAQVNVRIVDAKTGKVLHSVFGEDKQSKKVANSALISRSDKDPMSNELINDTIKNALQDVVRKIVVELFPVKVVTVKDDQVFLNIGDSMGFEIGDELNVYELGEAFVDPDTGIELGAEEKLVGTIKITDMKEKYSIAKGSKSELEKIQRGFVCRKKDTEADKKKK